MGHGNGSVLQEVTAVMKRTVSQWIIALVLAMVALLRGGSAGAQTDRAGSYEWQREGGFFTVQLQPPRGDDFEGLPRITPAVASLVASIRPERMQLLSAREAARARHNKAEIDTLTQRLAELECRTVCIPQNDQEWCIANHMNEWDGLDLTGEFNHETSTFPTCSNYNGTTCRWRHVQAISVWRCSELRAHGHIEASGAHSREIEVERVAAVDQHLGEVEQQINLQLVAANGVRDQAIRERDDARRELAAAQRNLAQAQTQLRARAAQARPNSTVTSTPAEGSATTSDSDGTNDREGLNERACTIESQTRTSITTRCPMPRHFDEAVLRTSRLAGRSATASEFSSLAPRYRPHLRQIAEILHLNRNARNCEGAILFACHADSPTPGHAYVYRRIGVCSGVEGQGTGPVTLADFVTIAQSECSRHPEITLQGVPGLLLRLRRVRVPIVADSTGQASATDPSGGAQRALTRADRDIDTTTTMLAHVDNGHFTPSREMMTFTTPPAVTVAWRRAVQIVRPMFASFAGTTGSTAHTCPVRQNGSPLPHTCGVRVAYTTSNLYTHIDDSEAPHGTPGRYQFLTD